jgi:hypothetical protein
MVLHIETHSEELNMEQHEQKEQAPAARVEKRRGSCHCGAVRFEVEIDVGGGTRCNCSICTKVGAIGGLVKPAAFTLLAGEGGMGEYLWGGKVATRYFCKHCGIHCFGRGHLAELGGDFVSINLNTLDDIDPYQLAVVHWDGRHDNWQAGPRPSPWPIFA